MFLNTKNNYYGAPITNCSTIIMQLFGVVHMELTYFLRKKLVPNKQFYIMQCKLPKNFNQILHVGDVTSKTLPNLKEMTGCICWVTRQANQQKTYAIQQSKGLAKYKPPKKQINLLECP